MHLKSLIYLFPFIIYSGRSYVFNQIKSNYYNANSFPGYFLRLFTILRLIKNDIFEFCLTISWGKNIKYKIL